MKTRRWRVGDGKKKDEQKMQNKRQKKILKLEEKAKREMEKLTK